jgi:hypothetical protein
MGRRSSSVFDKIKTLFDSVPSWLLIVWGLAGPLLGGFLRELLKDRFFGETNEWIDATFGPAMRVLASSALWLIWMAVFGAVLFFVWRFAKHSHASSPQVSAASAETLVGVVPAVAAIAAPASAADVPTRLRLRLDPAGTHGYLQESIANIDGWRQTIVRIDAAPELFQADTISITFQQDITYEQPIVESFGHKLGGYNFWPLGKKGAVFQFFDRIQAPVVEIWFPPLGYYQQKSKDAGPPPKRALSTYEAEQYVKAIDAFLKILKEDMEPLVMDGPGLKSGWWNAIKDPKNHPSYGDKLLAYRDLLVESTNRLEALRAKLPEFQELIVAAQPTAYNSVKRGVEDFLVAYQYVRSSLKDDTGVEVLHYFMKAPEERFAEAVREFTAWRNRAQGNVIDLRRAV